LEELSELIVGLYGDGLGVLSDTGSLVRVDIDEQHAHVIDGLADVLIIIVEAVHPLLISLRLLMAVPCSDF